MFFGVFATQDDFTTVLERCTQNYETLVLDNTLQVGQPSECVFWYKAKLDNGPFTIGRDVFFRLETKNKRAVPLTHPWMEDDTSNGGTTTRRSGKQSIQVTKENAEDDEDDER